MQKIKIIILVLLVQGSSLCSQEDKEQQKAVLEAQKMVADGNTFLVAKSNFPEAEGAYRKAMSKNPVDATAKYNLGNAYYYEKKYDEANQRFAEATQVAETKAEKHSAFHNQGNAFMAQKKYEEAVKSYKNALRNNPKDEETRYNLALAKKMLEKQEQENKDNDKNKDDKEDKDNKDQKDKGDDKKDKGDQGDEDKKDKKDKGDKGDDKKDNGDQGEDKKDDKDKGDDKKDKEGQEDDKKDEKDKGDKKQQPEGQPKPREGKLSPQQVKSLLEAMNNQEKKVQDKLNAKKTQGVKVKTDKDW